MRRFARSTYVTREPGVAGQLVGDRRARRAGERVASCQRDRVVAGRPGLHFPQRRRQVALQIRRQALVVQRRRRVGRQKQHVGQVVARGESRGLKIEDRRDQQDAVEREAPVDQVSGQPRRACRAVAFADHEQRRRPAPVARHVQADELADRLDVALHAPELAAQFGLGRAAVAGPHRIDEHQVGLVQPRRARCRPADTAAPACVPSSFIATRLGPSAPRCSQTDDEPGPPLNEIVSGRLDGIGDAVQRVRDEEDARLDLALRAADGQKSGCRGVAQRLAAGTQLVMGDDRRLRAVEGRCRLRRLGLCRRRLGLGRRRRGRWLLRGKARDEQGHENGRCGHQQVSFE